MCSSSYRAYSPAQARHGIAPEQQSRSTIDGETGAVFGKLAASLVRQGGGSPAHRVQDSWIAAQAIQHGLRLMSYNRKDFDDVPGLDVQVLQHAQSR